MAEADRIDCAECGTVLWSGSRVGRQPADPVPNADETDVTLTCPQCGRVNVLSDWSGANGSKKD